MRILIDVRDKSTWPEVMTPQQAAEILQVTPNHVYAQCDLFRRTGEGIRNRKLGSRVLIPRSAVTEFCEVK